MKLNLLAPLNDLGYGCAGVNLVRALSKSHEVAVFPIGQPRFNASQETVDVVRAGIERAKTYDDLAPSIRIWHQDALAEHVGKGAKIGFPFFEMDRLSEVEVYQANKLDLYLVASHWAKEVAERSGVRIPIGVVPLGVDREIFHPAETGLENTAWAKNTVFFNVGKWEIRKGHDVLLSAFNRAFEPADHVLLRMCCDNPFLGDGNAWWTRRYMTSKMGAAGKIEVLPNRLPDQHAVAAFMNQGDVGVFPARAEGWNLDLLEAMACGKQVIATDYSAHTEFCTFANSHLIRVYETEPAVDGVWFHGQGEWAKLGSDQEDVLIQHMRDLHRIKQQEDSYSDNFVLSTAGRFSWDASAAALIDALALMGAV